MATKGRYLVALLFDVEVASEVDGLRRALGSSQLERIPPHITLVPPTNYPAEQTQSAECVVRDAAATTGRVVIELGPPATFEDNLSVVYLAVEATAALEALRKSLLGAGFAGRLENAPPFIPHVTLLSTRQPLESRELLRGLSSYRRTVEITKVTLLRQVEELPGRPWRVAASYDLGSIAVLGRGGFELTLHAGAEHSEELAEALSSWGVSDLAPSGKVGEVHFAVALVGARLVGGALWRVRGDIAVLDVHAVAPTHRGIGVGTRLLDFIESFERRAGTRLVVVLVDPTSALAGFLRGRGYVSMGDLNFGEGDLRRPVGRVL